MIQLNQTILKLYPGLNQKRLEEEFDKFCELSRFCGEYNTNNQLVLKFEKFLSEGVPFEYINFESYFFESSFYVDERVLIPRSETEILVEKTLDLIGSKKNLKVLEIGVGSFCIGLSLLKEISSQIDYFLGTDISEDALSVAKINKLRYQKYIPHSHIELLQTDRLIGVKEKFDVIISNPPYIKISQKKLVHHQVEKFEPHTALYLEDEKYSSWYRDFFKQVKKSLLSGGFFLMEGHEENLADLKELGSQVFSKIEILQDLTRRDRFLLIRDVKS